MTVLRGGRGLLCPGIAAEKSEHGSAEQRRPQQECQAEIRAEDGQESDRNDDYAGVATAYRASSTWYAESSAMNRCVS